MIVERSQAKKKRDFTRADDLRDLLDDKYDVTVDDKPREWRTSTYTYVITGGRTLSEAEVQYVQEQLVQRTAFKKERDYDAADAIRDALEQQHSIAINDRALEWRAEAEWKVVEENTPEALTGDAADDRSDGGRPEGGAEAAFRDDGAGEEHVEAAVAAPPVDAVSDASLQSLTVVLLKEKLREAGLPVSGKKEELIERL